MPSTKGSVRFESEQWNGHKSREDHGNRSGVHLDDVVGKFHHQRHGDSRQCMISDHHADEQGVSVEVASSGYCVVIVQPDGHRVEEDAEGIKVKVLHVDVSLLPLLHDELSVHPAAPEKGHGNDDE